MEPGSGGCHLEGRGGRRDKARATATHTREPLAGRVPSSAGFGALGRALRNLRPKEFPKKNVAAFAVLVTPVKREWPG